VQVTWGESDESEQQRMGDEAQTFVQPFGSHKLELRPLDRLISMVCSLKTQVRSAVAIH
jgi:hypothetical protein